MVPVLISHTLYGHGNYLGQSPGCILCKTHAGGTYVRLVNLKFSKPGDFRFFLPKYKDTWSGTGRSLEFVKGIGISEGILCSPNTL